MLQAPIFSPATAGDHDRSTFNPFHPSNPANPPNNLFERLVRIYRDGELLLNQLRRTNAQLSQARDYLAGEGSNAALGRAMVERLRDRKSWLLARLRANRIAAQAVLGIPHKQNALPA